MFKRVCKLVQFFRVIKRDIFEVITNLICHLFDGFLIQCITDIIQKLRFRFILEAFKHSLQRYRWITHYRV